MNESCGWSRFLHPQASRVTTSLSLISSLSRLLGKNLLSRAMLFLFTEKLSRETCVRKYFAVEREKIKTRDFPCKTSTPGSPDYQKIYYSINFKFSEAVNSIIVVIFNCTQVNVLIIELLKLNFEAIGDVDKICHHFFYWRSPTKLLR